MRHLFVTNDFPPKVGGIESYLLNLCRGFEPEDIAVVAPAREGWQEVDRTLPYPVLRLPGSYLRSSRRVYNGVVQAVARLQADVVHFLAALPLGRLGPRLREATGAAYTVVAHGTGEILLPARVPLARRALRKVLTSADLVFPVSSFTHEAVENITNGAAKTVVVNPSVDTERFSLDVSGGALRGELGLGSTFVALFVSRLVKRKGADILIRAVGATDDVVAVIAGTGPERASLERLAREVDASDRVIFAGFVPDDRLPTYYAASDCFCMPCTNRYGGLETEGFGVVYLEAQACGLPCIAGRCGGSAEAVEHGVTGIVIDEPTPELVARSLQRFQADPALCARLGGAGRARVERDFAPEVAAAHIEDALQAVIG